MTSRLGHRGELESPFCPGLEAHLRRGTEAASNAQSLDSVSSLVHASIKPASSAVAHAQVLSHQGSPRQRARMEWLTNPCERDCRTSYVRGPKGTQSSGGRMHLA